MFWVEPHDTACTALEILKVTQPRVILIIAPITKHDHRCAMIDAPDMVARKFLEAEP
jgi:hypothetical protein